MQPQRYPAAYDAIRKDSPPVLLCSFSLPLRKARRARAKDKKCSAVEDEIGGKNQFYETELATSLFELEQENVACRACILRTNRPTGFVHEHYLEWQPRARHQRFFLFFYVSLVNVRRFPPGEIFWDVIHTRSSMNSMLRGTGLTGFSPSMHFWIKLIFLSWHGFRRKTRRAIFYIIILHYFYFDSRKIFLLSCIFWNCS